MITYPPQKIVPLFFMHCPVYAGTRFGGLKTRYTHIYYPIPQYNNIFVLIFNANNRYFPGQNGARKKYKRPPVRFSFRSSRKVRCSIPRIYDPSIARSSLQIFFSQIRHYLSGEVLTLHTSDNVTLGQHSSTLWGLTQRLRNVLT